jgi:tRNA(Arg) A34 adenosine deaminase TadA
MRLAIDKTLQGIESGQTPFGACIAKAGKVISLRHNGVWEDTDITAHAEILAIRDACRVLGTVDLSGCVIYSTCEPCPMCFSACHWARVNRIYYGADIADAREAGFHELSIANTKMKQLGGSELEISGGILKNECAHLFKVWIAAPGHRTY